MRSRELRRLIAGELLAVALLVVWLTSGWNWSWGRALVWGIGLFFAARAFMVLLTHGVAWLLSSAPRPLAPLAALAHLGREYLAYLALFTFIQPFERHWLGRERLTRPGPGQHPLLLIHGYRCNRGTWWWLRRRLTAAGQCVATINLEPTLGNIDDFAALVHGRIEQICQETGTAQVTLVGHSMGGLVIRAYLRRYGAQRLVRAITLGTPHHGSLLARFAQGPNGHQMRPGHPWLQALNADPASRCAPLSAIFSDRDQYVLPFASQILPGADNRQVHGLGHLALVFSPRVAHMILALLAEPPAPVATAKPSAE